jgi:hypothetical protein
MRDLSLTAWIDRRFKHGSLYQFWWRSQGIWLSKLAKVSLRLLDDRELRSVYKLHALEQPEFGVKMNWEYYSKPLSGQMVWFVDSTQADLIFIDKSVGPDSQPDIYSYRVIDGQTLVTTNGSIEETTMLDGHSRRVRELRLNGKLFRRIWENKLGS